MNKEELVTKTDFDKHIKEDEKRFSSIDEAIKDLKNDVKGISISVNDSAIILKDLVIILKAAGIGKRFVIGSAIFVGSIVGLVMGFKTIIGWFK